MRRNIKYIISRVSGTQKWPADDKNHNPLETFCTQISQFSFGKSYVDDLSFNLTIYYQASGQVPDLYQQQTVVLFGMD